MKKEITLESEGHYCRWPDCTCDMSQGKLCSHPMPPKEVASALTAANADQDRLREMAGSYKNLLANADAALLAAEAERDRLARELVVVKGRLVWAACTHPDPKKAKLLREWAYE